MNKVPDYKVAWAVMYMAGATLEQVSLEYGTYQQAVRKALIDLGIPRRKPIANHPQGNTARTKHKRTFKDSHYLAPAASIPRANISRIYR